jgi:hypothetical protein
MRATKEGGMIDRKIMGVECADARNSCSPGIVTTSTAQDFL